MFDTSLTELVARWFPAAFFTFVASFYTARILWLHRAGGARRVEKRNLDGSFCAAHLTFRILRVSIWGAAVARAFYPPFDQLLLPIAFLTTPTVMLAGDALLVAALLWILYVHMSMGESWQSGITHEAPLPLTTQGIFAHSRNPTFLGIMAGQVGFFLAVPSLFALICLILGIWAIGVRVRKEEAYLSAVHGEAYRRYRSVTPRWFSLPGFRPTGGTDMR